MHRPSPRIRTGDRPHGHELAHEHARPGALADLLDRDAALLGGYLDEAVAWITDEAEREMARIADLGSGTGIGSIALAGRFVGASIVAVDRSVEMLERVRATAAERGLDGRITPVQADLDVAWPDAAHELDLIWASSSLHEVRDPDRVLTGAHVALRSGGLIAVIEMDGLPRFLSGTPDAAALESRCHAALADAGWNSFPNWAPHLRNAGFEIVSERRFDGEAASADVVDFARATLSHIRTSAAEQLAPDDRDALDRLLGDDQELRRTAASVRGSRVAWLARRPH